jgi:hypothetical protein
MFAKAGVVGAVAAQVAAGFGPISYDLTEPYDSDMDFSVGNTVVTFTSPVSGYGYCFFEHDLLGKCYGEAVATYKAGNNTMPICVGAPDHNLEGPPANGSPGGSYRSQQEVFYNGDQYNGPGIYTGDVIGLAVDIDALTFQYYKNNVAVGTSFPMKTSGGPWRWRFATWAYADGPNMVITIPQTPIYTPPAGYTWVGNLS